MQLRRNEEINKDLIKDLQDNDALKKQKVRIIVTTMQWESKPTILREEPIYLFWLTILNFTHKPWLHNEKVPLL